MSTGKKQVKGVGRGNHPNTQAGRKKTQFKPGESGNPQGKPPGTKDRATVVRKWVEAPSEVKNPVTKETERGTVEDLIVLGQITQAIKGNTQAFVVLMDAVYGKQTELRAVSGDVTLRVKYGDEK